jgi:hypothetical protein
VFIAGEGYYLIFELELLGEGFVGVIVIVVDIPKNDASLSILVVGVMQCYCFRQELLLGYIELFSKENYLV